VSRFPFLIDQPEDGYMEDTGWLPAGAAMSPDEAVAEFTRLYREMSGVHPLDERNDVSQLVCVGRVFETPYLTRRDESPRETKTCSTCGHQAVVHTGGCTMSTTRAAQTTRCTCPAFVPVMEYGYTEVEIVGSDVWAAVDANEASEEDVCYRASDADDPHAEEFWRIEVETFTVEVAS